MMKKSQVYTTLAEKNYKQLLYLENDCWNKFETEDSVLKTLQENIFNPAQWKLLENTVSVNAFEEIELYTNAGIEEIGDLVLKVDNDDLKNIYDSLQRNWYNFQKALIDAGFNVGSDIENYISLEDN